MNKRSLKIGMKINTYDHIQRNITTTFNTNNRELKQPRRQGQQLKPPQICIFDRMKNNIFVRFARAFFIFWLFEDVLVLSTTWNDLFWSCVDDVSRWWQMFNFIFLCPKRWFQFNSRIVRTHFQAKWLGTTAKLLQKREVTFSDDVLASVVVLFA